MTGEASAQTEPTNPENPQKGHRWFAALYDPLSRAEERGTMGRRRDALLDAVEGDVVEIGAGTGANFSHYSPSARVVAFEPDPFMLARARQKLSTLKHANIEARQAPAEQLPIPDASCDVAISTLVLCTVQDMPRALAEMKRVLRPGGELRFIEHVRANGAGGLVLDLIQPVWGWFSAGCHCNRRTESTIRAAGFEIVSIERSRLMPWMVPVITGVARVR